jgi:hypothetical protein
VTESTEPDRTALIGSRDVREGVTVECDPRQLKPAVLPEYAVASGQGQIIRMHILEKLET